MGADSGHESVDLRWLARRAGLYLAAPGAMALTVLIGMTFSSTSNLPQGVTSTITPHPHAIGQPISIEIPSLRAKAPVIPISLTGDVLEPPANVRTVGWWRGSAEPGSPTGQSLLTGHATHKGVGYSPLNHLKDIRRGATILIRSRDRTAGYLVQDVFIWSKKTVAKHSRDLFDPDYHDSRLVLVTSARYDGRKWNANVIVFAYPN
ncbi:MAG TPA: class F sortase [Aeromicrobium sp.]|nr:class F sortase [Aeromicrobium sp.]